VTRFSSVGARLSFALLLVLAGALAIVYLVVVPSLESSLVDDRLSELDRNARTVAETLASDDRGQWLLDVVGSADLMNARVTVLTAESDGSVREYVDSSGKYTDLTNDPIAVSAVRRNRIVRGTVTRNDRRYAEVALPLARGGPVVLLSNDLSDRLANIDVVQRRLVLAAAIAIAVSLAAGYLAAHAFARRIRRLERAADRIASGEFDEPVVDGGADELGQLAEAFERMRLQLQGLDRARGEFIANASHELRTPLFSLSGFLELMTDEELDDETRSEFLATMREQVARLARMATDLLDLSRLDAGNVRLDVGRLDLAALADALASEFAPAAQLEGHLLETSTDGDVPALGDEERVLQVGRLLVENAIRHTPPGTRIVVGAGSDGIAARLVVENDGPPIPPEHAGQIFERFYRVEGGRASGSGLGLAIARELAELMGGRIQLDSGPEKTSFSLVLPVVTERRRESQAVFT
jgi:two-component system, OmpR family, sensor kinase